MARNTQFLVILTLFLIVLYVYSSYRISSLTPGFTENFVLTSTVPITPSQILVSSFANVNAYANELIKMIDRKHQDPVPSVANLLANVKNSQKEMQNKFISIIKLYDANLMQSKKLPANTDPITFYAQDIYNKVTVINPGNIAEDNYVVIDKALQFANNARSQLNISLPVTPPQMIKQSPNFMKVIQPPVPTVQGFADIQQDPNTNTWSVNEMAQVFTQNMYNHSPVKPRADYPTAFIPVDYLSTDKYGGKMATRPCVVFNDKFYSAYCD